MTEASGASGASGAVTLRAAPDRARFALLALPGIAFLAIRALGIGVLDLFSPPFTDLSRLLAVWDGQWYLGLAANGYAHVAPQLTDAHGMRGPNSPLVFFPGYPAAVNLVSRLGLDMLAAGLLVSILSGLAASYGLMRIAELVSDRPRRVGLILVTLFAAAPMGIVLSMAYSEALCAALAIWAIVFVLRRQWIAAGILSLFGGLLRPTTVALVLAVGLAALAAVIRDPRDWRAWLGGVLSPLGLLGYLAWVAVRTGSLTGYFDIEHTGWDTGVDFGDATVRYAGLVLGSRHDPYETVTVLLLVAALVLFTLCLKMRLPWPLLVYTGVMLFMDVGTSGLMGAKARLLIPAFGLLIPVAVGLARRRTGTALAVLAGLVVFSAWFGAYALTVWPYAI